jgi:hypothetical protein
MGISYFNNASWNEITREERFFCLQLYNHIQFSGEKGFVQYLIDLGLQIPLDNNWEIGFEVCFYRDVLFSRKEKVPPSLQKRTFDLCLMSDDAIVIIEAKAQGGFEGKQLRSFKNDAAEIFAITGIRNVKSIAIHSSKYNPKIETLADFQVVLTWDSLSAFYGNDPVLLKANGVYGDSIEYQILKKN